MIDNFEFEGAEAKLIKQGDRIIKKIRIAKTYRLEILDKKLRNFRNKREFKILTRLYENQINVPKPLQISNNKEEEIYFLMEYIDAKPLKYSINKELLFKSFKEIIKIHNLDITHGDLTTLNILNKNGKIIIIDFGLALFSNNIEEKAVDLNLFFNCIKNEHPNLFEYKEELCEEYIKNTNKGKEIIQRLQEVELRGRNKNKN